MKISLETLPKKERKKIFKKFGKKIYKEIFKGTLIYIPKEKNGKKH